MALARCWAAGRSSGADGYALYERGQRSWLGVLQLSGIPGHPNGMALFASMALLLQSLSFPAVRRRPMGQQIVFLGVGPAASTAALVWSQSRTGVLCAAATISLLVLVRALRRWTWLPAALLGAAAASSAVPPLLTLAGFSFHGRWFPWSVAWEELQGNWLLGVGPSLFTQAFWDEWILSQPAWWEPGHAHNQILASLAMLGIVGLSVLVAAVAVMIGIASRAGFQDSGWAIAVCAILFINAGPETVLGVGAHRRHLLAGPPRGSSARLILAHRRATIAREPGTWPHSSCRCNRRLTRIAQPRSAINRSGGAALCPSVG